MVVVVVIFLSSCLLSPSHLSSQQSSCTQVLILGSVLGKPQLKCGLLGFCILLCFFLLHCGLRMWVLLWHIWNMIRISTWAVPLSVFVSTSKYLCLFQGYGNCYIEIQSNFYYYCYITHALSNSFVHLLCPALKEVN
jgi:hypothetical protein